MAKKKNPEPENNAEEQKLEARVDAMMEARADESAFVGPRESLPEDSGGPTAVLPDSELPPLDIFAGTQSAPELPKELLKETDVKGQSPKVPQAEPNTVETLVDSGDTKPQELAALDLDDAANDAAVDDIVAHESDEPGNELEENSVQHETERPAGKRHHPIFWGTVTVIAVIAVVAAVLLASGGNLTFPGGKQLQNWFNSISN